MIQISNQIDIARPVADVFAFISDYRNNPKWQPVQAVTAVSTGPVGVGTTYKQQILLMGATYQVDCRITAFEQDKTLSFVMDSPVFAWRGDYGFQALDTNNTRLSAQGGIELKGGMRFAEGMVAPQIRKLIDDTAPNLKRILESS